MATFDDKLTDVLSAPLGDLIASVGRGVAQAQEALDAQSLETFRALAGDTAGYEELRAVGYRPTWYAIPEAEAEIAIALTVVGRSETAPVSPFPVNRLALRATPMDAAYSRRFEFDLKAASKLKFRIVPVPPASATEGMQLAPDLVGMPVAQARSTVEPLGIELMVAWGEGAEDERRAVSSQQPPAGGIVLADGSIAVVVGLAP